MLLKACLSFDRIFSEYLIDSVDVSGIVYSAKRSFNVNLFPLLHGIYCYLLARTVSFRWHWSMWLKSRPLAAATPYGWWDWKLTAGSSKLFIIYLLRLWANCDKDHTAVSRLSQRRRRPCQGIGYYGAETRIQQTPRHAVLRMEWGHVNVRHYFRRRKYTDDWGIEIALFHLECTDENHVS